MSSNGSLFMADSKRVLFIGSKQQGYAALETIFSVSRDSLIGILTLDDSGDTRTVLPRFMEFSERTGVPLDIASNRKASEEVIKRVRPDLCLVVGWYWLIDSAVLALVKDGMLGVHNSLLPRYLGGSPLIWSILNGDREVGFSLFSFTSGMDDGPVWARCRASVSDDDYIADILVKLERELMEMLRQKFPLILQGTIKPTQQDHDQATYCAPRVPDDGLVDWRKPACDVYNFIRAQSSPYPGAFTYLDGTKLVLWRAKLFQQTYFGTPGQIARIGSEGVYLICGSNTAVLVTDTEYSGDRANPSKFITSIRTRLPSGR